MTDLTSVLRRKLDVPIRTQTKPLNCSKRLILPEEPLRNISCPHPSV
jgi:hypothetical protein